jgi:hypothetical protein
MDIQKGIRAFGSAILQSGNTIGSFGTSYESNYIAPVVIGIVAVIILIGIIYIALLYRKTDSVNTQKHSIDLFNPASPVVIGRDMVRSIFRNSYTLSFYIQINAVPDMRISVPALTWPGIWDLNYHSTKEELVWSFASVGTTDRTLITVPSVPLQKWMQVAVTFEGRTVDMYVNGSLLNSTTLSNLPPIPNSSITIVPGQMIGQIAYIQSWPRRLRVKEMADNYVSTSDSQGRPLLDPDFFLPITKISLPRFFCVTGNCDGNTPTASASQKWEFPYA